MTDIISFLCVGIFARILVTIVLEQVLKIKFSKNKTTGTLNPILGVVLCLLGIMFFNTGVSYFTNFSFSVGFFIFELVALPDYLFRIKRNRDRNKLNKGGQNV